MEPNLFTIMGKPHTGLDECPKILLSCFRDFTSGESSEWTSWSNDSSKKIANSESFEEIARFKSFRQMIRVIY